MLDPETRRKAKEIGAPGLVDIMEIVGSDPSYAALSFDEKMRIVVDHVHSEMHRRRVDSLIKSAKLRFPHADISNIIYEGRPLSRDLVNQLGTSQFVANATDVILEGFTGTGKSHLACALAKQACKNGIKTLYVRMPDMLAFREERMKAGWSEKKVLRKFAGFKVLVVDEWLIDKPTTEQMHFLLELTELRYDSSSTIYCSQYSNKDWHRRMGGGAHAESVMDRIVHNAVVIAMGEVNMRELTMGKSI